MAVFQRVVDLTDPPEPVVEHFLTARMTGFWREGIKPGEPTIKFKTLYFLVPQGSLVERVEVIPGKEIFLGREYVSPMQYPIQNKGNNNVTGLLTLKVQKLVGNEWQDEEIILLNSEQTIPANGHLALDTIWNPLGWTAAEAGTYRVFAEFKKGGNNWTGTFEFLVETQ